MDGGEQAGKFDCNERDQIALICRESEGNGVISFQMFVSSGLSSNAVMQESHLFYRLSNSTGDL